MNLLEARKTAAQKRLDALNAALEPVEPKPKNKPKPEINYDVIDTEPDTNLSTSATDDTDTKTDDFSDNIFSNKMKNRNPKGYKAFVSDMNLNLMRDVSPERKAGIKPSGRKAGIKPSGRSFDMNLMADREGSTAYKEREKQRLKRENSAVLLRQQKLSREADKESYQKIKNFIKPHAARIMKKAVTRNYWSKDIKPVLGTIADALRR